MVYSHTPLNTDFSLWSLIRDGGFILEEKDIEVGYGGPKLKRN